MEKMFFNDDEGYDPDETLRPSKQVVVGICCMSKKGQSKPMKEILTRLEEFELIRTVVFPEEVILNEPVSKWPICDCLISFHSKGFPLAKAVEYERLRSPFVLNDLNIQFDIQDRRKVYRILEKNGIELPRYAVIDRDHSSSNSNIELVEFDDHIEIGEIVFNKPFVEKPVNAEDHNIYIYYPTSTGGGSQRLFRKIDSRSSVYSSESKVRKTGSFIYEEFMQTAGTDVKVYTVGPDYAHAEARKSPALDGKVERDKDGKEIRYPIILNNSEKLIARNVCLAFEQTVCGFDLLRANGKSFVCDVNGFSFVKNSIKYYDDSAKILGNMILRALAPSLRIPWSIPFQLDDPPIVETTFGKMMELCCAIAIIRHADRTPKQKMKMEVKDSRFFDIFEKNGGFKTGHVKLKKPKQLQEILDIARSLLNELDTNPESKIKEDKCKLEQLVSVLEMYGSFSGINRKIQLKYTQKDSDKEGVLRAIVKWDGELTSAGRVEAESLGRIFRLLYPGGQGQYAGSQGLGLLRLHSTFRHDLKIYASDEGRVMTTAAAFAKGLLALEGELTPILAQMVKSANTNGLLDNDCESSKFQNQVKLKLHEKLQENHDFTPEDYEILNPTKAKSIENAMNSIRNPYKVCEEIFELVKKLNVLIQEKREKQKKNGQEYHLYQGETYELMQRRWSKLEKDFKTKNDKFDISKIPDIYDCIKYDLRHNRSTLQNFPQSEELYVKAKALADIVIPQEYGMTKEEKLIIGLGICGQLLKKIRGDLLRDYNEEESENVNRLNPHYSEGVSSPGRHVKTRYGGLVDETQDEQWKRAMDYVSKVSELNYLSQIVIMLYEDSSKDITSEERFHLELHFSPGVVCSVQQNLPKGPGFRPSSRGNLRSSDTKLTLPIKNFLNKTRIIKEEEFSSIDENITDESLTEIVDMSNELKNKITTIQLNRSKSCSPVSTKDFRGSEVPLELSKSFSNDFNLVHQNKKTTTNHNLEASNFNSKVNASSSKSENHSILKVPCETTAPEFNEPKIEIQDDFLELPKQSDDLKSSSADKLMNKVEFNIVTAPTIEQDSPPHTPKEKKSLSITYDQILKPFPIIRSNSVSNTSPMGIRKKEHNKSSLSMSLFSTAVISGSSSAPDLKEVLNPPDQQFKSVPSIRPLETLSNALSLKQLDNFLFKMINSNLYRYFCTHPRQVKRKAIQIIPYNDLDIDLNTTNLNKIILEEMTDFKDRKTSTDSQNSRLSIVNLIDQPNIAKANTISSSSTFTSNLSDISGSNSQLQVLSSGPASIVSSSSVPSSPTNNLDYWKKTSSFFNHHSSMDQSDIGLSASTPSFSSPPSPSLSRDK